MAEDKGEKPVFFQLYHVLMLLTVWPLDVVVFGNFKKKNLRQIKVVKYSLQKYLEVFPFASETKQNLMQVK